MSNVKSVIHIFVYYPSEIQDSMVHERVNASGVSDLYSSVSSANM